MTVHYNLHQFGQDEFAVVRLINGELHSTASRFALFLVRTQYVEKREVDTYA